LGNERYVLWAEGIGKSFGSVVALKSASLWAEPGKVTTLMGRNGSGKTTLMRIAAGELRADYGVVSFFGDVRERHTLAGLARMGLMYLPQEQLPAPGYTVRDHVRAVAVTFGEDWVDEAIEETRLGALMDHRVEVLSGGERMRVSLGLAFARRPTVLIADEPLVGLAPKDQEQIARALRRLARSGVAVVTSGHDAQALLDISDVVLWSVAGTTHHIGSAEDALRHEQFCREYLGPKFHRNRLDAQKRPSTPERR